MDQDAGFLAARGDSTGSFVRWLESLEVDLPRDVAIREMIAYGWIHPTCRVMIPDRYFTSWTSYPSLGGEPFEIEDEDAWGDLLWHSGGTSDGFLYRHFPLTGEWFVHPLERNGEPLAQRFAEARALSQLHTGHAKAHANGATYYPWIDYFPHWKGYELIEVLNSAKLVGGVWCTTNTESILRQLLLRHDTLRERCLGWLGRIHREWKGRRRSFEHLARYRMMRSVLSITGGDPRKLGRIDRWSVEDAARALSSRFQITQDLLENQFLPDLLSLARDWRRWNERDGGRPGKHAWGQLQKDILFTVEWLHLLTGNTIEHYYDVWANRDRRPRNVLALEEALPQEFRSAEQYFLSHFLAVRGSYDHLPATVRLTDAEVAQVLKSLRAKTPIVTDWLLNYQRLHEALGGPPAWDYADVTPNTILHDFTLLALFAEKILEALSTQTGPDVMGLAREFCQGLESKDNRFAGTWQLAATNWKQQTQLRSKPGDPFGDLIRLPLIGSAEAVNLARALLFFGLARNYFGHHSYLDGALLNTPEGGAAVSGVVTTTLYLTAVPCGVR